MTNRERVLKALRREPVDYIPFVGRFNPLTPVQRNGVWNFPWPQDDTDAMLTYVTEKLGITHYANFGIGCMSGYSNCEVKLTEEGSLLRKEVITPAGSLTAVIENNELWPHGNDIPFSTDFTVHFRKAWITCAEDIEKLKYVFGSTTIEDIKPYYDYVKTQSEKYDLPIASHIGQGLTMALQMFLPEPLMVAIVDEPELVEAFLKLEHDVNMANIKLSCELGCDVICRNGFYETCDFYSPDQLRHFVGDYLREECELAHSYGKLVVYTLHTGIMPMLDYLKEIPFDAIFGTDPNFPGVDIRKIKAELGDSMAFEMGPCSIREFSSRNTNDVRVAIRNLIDVFGKTGFVLTPSVSMHSIMPWENFEAAVDEWKKVRNPPPAMPVSPFSKGDEI
ncbi:MAG: uroporphyrinogen decarboxylase family protein [Oscillospiraceae bacterium]|nr:uroporphyrinogen decarboxylase family protein [Oscillospiraceae bacterium]